jgi:hypothetical protein
MDSVLLINLRDDGSAIERGCTELDTAGLDDARLRSILERFEQATPRADLEAEIHIDRDEESYVVRGANGSLYLTAGHNINMQNIRVTPDEVIAHVHAEALSFLEQVERLRKSEEDAEARAFQTELARTSHKALLRGVIAVVAVLVGFGSVPFSAWMTYGATPWPGAEGISKLDNESIVAKHLDTYAGRYTTGNGRGDRAIELSADGRLRYQERVHDAASGTLRWRDVASGPGTFGHRQRILGLQTWEGGWIECLSPQLLSFHGETYTRR